jgi:Acetyltransferase (GNAT) domain
VVCNSQGDILGTTLWWAYGERFGTLGLVLVDQAHQGQGIGRRLMNVVLADAGDRALQLNATNAGLKLYRQCGFEDRSTISQHQGELGALPAIRVDADTVLRPVSNQDQESLIHLDAAAMGAPRAAIISAVLAGGSGVVSEQNGRMTGFALARPSGRGTVVGPVVAEDERVATALIARMLSNTNGFARVDIPAHAPHLASFLEAAGLACVDQVKTMVRGKPPEPAGAARVYGLVSQALN